VLGYIGQADYTFGFGKAKVGGWYEHAKSGATPGISLDHRPAQL
jgi:hypothetical protein